MEIRNTYVAYSAGSRFAAGQAGMKKAVENETENEQIEEQTDIDQEASVSLDGKPSGFRNTGELLQYLSRTYSTVNQGMVKLSGSYLQECLSDENKLKELFDNLSAADTMEKDAKENLKGYQGMKITVDREGKMETESYGGSVAFNEAKRARQLAAAKSVENIRTVMALLQKDLSDCQNGLRNGMCDENEVAKVQAMIQQVMKRMSELSATGENVDKEQGFDSFSINMLI